MSNVIQFVPKSAQSTENGEALRESAGAQQSAGLHSIFQRKNADYGNRAIAGDFELAADLYARAAELEEAMWDIFADIEEIACRQVDNRKVMDELFINYLEKGGGIRPISAGEARALTEQFAMQIRVPPVPASN